MTSDSRSQSEAVLLDCVNLHELMRKQITVQFHDMKTESYSLIEKFLSFEEQTIALKVNG